MTSLIWLALAAVAGVGAYVFGWGAVSGYRARRARDMNAERYLAWRGRARARPAASSVREDMTRDERMRVLIAAILGVLAALALLAFFLAG